MEITKEKFLEMAKWGNFDQMRELQKDFPEAFKVELEVGKVYRYKDSAKIIKITKIKNSLDKFYGYGFDWSGCYCGNIIGYYLDLGLWKEASAKEWESRLIEEANKIGYKNGNYKCLFRGYMNNLKSNRYFFDNENLYIGNSSDYGASYNQIFKHGVWAEIIKTMTK